MKDYQIRKAEQRNLLPEIDLLPLIQHGGKQLNVAVFGPNSYGSNIAEMQKSYFHSGQFPNISFRPAPTSESVSVVAHGFGKKGSFDAKRDILDPKWSQAGYIVRTPDGVYANTQITDEAELRKLRDKAKEVNGIWILENGAVEGVRDFGFAPYETFTRDAQDCDTFAQGGLARILEHTPEKEARHLRMIASPKFYKRGVYVLGFDPVKEPTPKVVCLNSGGYLVDFRLYVCGYDWDDYDGGCAFGVLDSAEGTAQN